MTGWDNFNKYIGVQGVLAFLMTGTLIGLLFLQYEVPDVVVGLLGTSWGFYFAKNGTNVVNALRGAGSTP